MAGRKARRQAALPWAVKRCLASQNRFAPPANRDPRLRRWSREIAGRLSKLDPKVWELDIDWRENAVILDRCARQEIVGRSASDERKAHAKIAAAMRKAANLLKAENQLDPLLIGTLDVISTHYSDTFKPFAIPRRLNDDEPRLSDFLRAAASFVEGEQARVYGLHRVVDESARSGKDGAAIRAAAALRRFFEAKTGQPHNELMKSIVSTYFPDVETKDWASTLDKRKVHEKKKRKIAQK